MRPPGRVPRGQEEVVAMTMAAEPRTPTLVETVPAADPAPLGLGAFALTTFLLSGHNASFIPDLIWVGVALFYGGMAQLLAGMWEFRNRNVFGATAFSTYGGFWLSFGIFIVLAETSQSFSSALAGANLPNAVAWFLIAFAIFNLYMLLWSTQVSVAVFLVFATLQATEIILAIGFFDAGNGNLNNYWIHLGGWVGIATAACAWYASAAGVINGMMNRHVLPVGAPLSFHHGPMLHAHRA
jgi:succinate-acetate transporter protein